MCGVISNICTNAYAIVRVLRQAECSQSRFKVSQRAPEESFDRGRLAREFSCSLPADLVSGEDKIDADACSGDRSCSAPGGASLRWLAKEAAPISLALTY
jgi:hypothetical protein